MRDLISRQDVVECVYKALRTPPLKGVFTDTMSLAISMVNDLPSAQPEHGQWNNHEVACLIADLFDDPCACNFNSIDEWLPTYCDFSSTCCPNPDGVACWEQYLKHLDKRHDEVEE